MRAVPAKEKPEWRGPDWEENKAWIARQTSVYLEAKKKKIKRTKGSFVCSDQKRSEKWRGNLSFKELNGRMILSIEQSQLHRSRVASFTGLYWLGSYHKASRNFNSALLSTLPEEVSGSCNWWLRTAVKAVDNNPWDDGGWTLEMWQDSYLPPGMGPVCWPW